VIYNPTEFISQSIDAVYHTLFEAVMLVVWSSWFLQNWRAAVIPIIAIPVSLIGTATMLAAVGYSLNSLSLFGLVLAIGIVVDDAIVVVENVERNIEHGMSPLEAARTSMDEVAAALVAIVLVLCAVFVPTLFITGISGAFYQQFAVTISTATVISLLLSLTLSPAAAALLLRQARGWPTIPPPRWKRVLAQAGDRFNTGFDRLSDRYGRLTRWLLARRKKVLATYAALIAPRSACSGRHPAGSFRRRIRAISWPWCNCPRASLERTDAVTREVAAKILPIKGLRGAVMFAGFHGPSQTSAPNSAAIYFPFKSFAERGAEGVTYAGIMEQAGKAVEGYDKARILLVPPPVIQGIGAAGGYRYMLQDREGRATTR
jgi:multidrug efflux pump subunit AcrB